MGVLVEGLIDPNLRYNNTINSCLRSGDVIIKRERINYSVPQKVRLGMLPPSVLEEYYRQQEAAAAATTVEEAPADPAPAPAAESSDSSHKSNKPAHGHTFWEDAEDKPLLSQADFEKFLKENALDIY